ncbi:branched-chain amino acid transport ATP-binding protein LivG [Lachnospiraceae bacterium KM106-2]|nr:branched-chain amino acid transport ATP-binding protein LivG [Lachnospiraceae bacterium KM106-2]
MALLEVKNLGISFGGLRAVDGCNMKVERGDLYGLIGPNGAGKTTVFNLLTGVYRPTEGNIYLEGKSIVGMMPHQIAKEGIARTFQNIRLFHKMSVIDNVKAALHNQIEYSFVEGVLRLPAYYKKERRIQEVSEELLGIFQLEEYATQRADSLPYGSQRKLEIARALATKPKLLLLDEPAAGMNPNETEELMRTMEIIRNRFQVTILLIEHDMRFVAGICNKITVLNFGTVLAMGEPKQVLQDSRVITAYLGD